MSQSEIDMFRKKIMNAVKGKHLVRNCRYLATVFRNSTEERKKFILSQLKDVDVFDGKASLRLWMIFTRLSEKMIQDIDELESPLGKPVVSVDWLDKRLRRFPKDDKYSLLTKDQESTLLRELRERFDKKKEASSREP